MRSDPSSRPPPIADVRQLVLATYNVHRAIGTDERADPARIAAVLREMDADVVALQEVGASDAADTEALLERLTDATGMQAIRGFTLRDARGEYGNALLTRLEPARVERVDLTVADREPRGALVTTIETGRRTLRLVATHLGLRARERRQQARRLASVLVEEANAGRVTALLGDFNEWWPRAASIRILERHLGRAARPATFPSGRPLLALDRILVHPLSSLEGLHVHRSTLARRASDHLPLVARIRL